MNRNIVAGADPPEIVVDRVTRTLVGPQRQRVDIPPLSLRLLEALARASPGFVSSDTLLLEVWSHSHLSADTLKQRVRLVRNALREAGYQPGLLSSARGEGYALRARLCDPENALGNAAVAAPSRWNRRRVLAGAVLVIGLAGSAYFALQPGPPSEQRIGPSPVRLGIIAPPADPLDAQIRQALAGTVHLAIVPLGERAERCQPPADVHLCLILEPAADATDSRQLSLLQISSGAILLQHTWRASDPPKALSVYLLQLSQFVTPGVLRWFGGRTGAGDLAFSHYREGVRMLGRCDASSRDEVIIGLRAAILDAANFLPARALLLTLELDSAQADADRAEMVVLAERARQLAKVAPDLALAQLASARGLSASDTDQVSQSGIARAVHLQPILARFKDADGGIPIGPDQPRCQPRASADRLP